MLHAPSRSSSYLLFLRRRCFFLFFYLAPLNCQLDELLKDSERIRDARAEERAPDALLPLGDSDDYSAPVQAKAIDLGNVRDFAVGRFVPRSLAHCSLAAAFFLWWIVRGMCPTQMLAVGDRVSCSL